MLFKVTLLIVFESLIYSSESVRPKWLSPMLESLIHFGLPVGLFG